MTGLRQNVRLICWVCIVWLTAVPALTQQPNSPAQPAETNTPAAPADPATTLLPHLKSERFWISAQDNIIFQYHPSFRARYSGPNSLRPRAESATSNVGTLYLGYALARHTEIFFDLESADGGGISDALGLAGFTNVDVVRNPQLGVTPYIARGIIRQIVPLGKEEEEVERGPLSLASRLPVRRLEFRAGKFGMADFFDINSVGTDSHFQFMNWTVDNAGTYDYAADTRGYTVGVIAEYHDRGWAFRFSEALMPKVANGIDLVWNLRKARAENYELELHPNLIGKRASEIRLLSFVNHANMGIYKEAIANFLAGKTPTPDITAHPFRTTVKYGFEINLEQEITRAVRGFARWGWNEGQHESFAYTEVDQTVEMGADVTGQRWKRSLDKVGLAITSNGISAYHQKYLALGGRGFLLGDGALNYGRENIVESYYNAHVWRGVFAGVDLQHINNPGYNRDRGPVWVPGLRLHLEF